MHNNIMDRCFICMDDLDDTVFLPLDDEYLGYLEPSIINVSYIGQAHPFDEMNVFSWCIESSDNCEFCFDFVIDSEVITKVSLIVESNYHTQRHTSSLWVV